MIGEKKDCKGHKRIIVEDTKMFKRDRDKAKSLMGISVRHEGKPSA